nr:GNAT family N-acetyltransferase [Oscillospiraceae bacterium]
MILSYAPALEEDILPILQLNKALINRYEELSSIDYPSVIRWVRQNIEKQLPHFRRVLMDGTPAGYFCLCPSDRKWELDSLFIFPEYQGNGIGTEVIRTCLNASGGKLFLYVFKDNTGALRLYERMGFQIVKEARKTAYLMEYKKQDC